MCISSPLPALSVTYDDVPGATPNSSAYCHFFKIGVELATLAVSAVETIIAVALTEATRTYNVPPLTEIKSPAARLAAAFALP